MAATLKGPAAREQYLASLRETLLAKKAGADVITPAAKVEAPTFTLAPAPTLVHRDVKPEPVRSAQTSPYSESGVTTDDERRASDEHHVELAAVASALVTVAARLADLARVLGGTT